MKAYFFHYFDTVKIQILNIKYLPTKYFYDS